MRQEIAALNTIIDTNKTVSRNVLDDIGADTAERLRGLSVRVERLESNFKRSCDAI